MNKTNNSATNGAQGAPVANAKMTLYTLVIDGIPHGGYHNLIGNVNSALDALRRKKKHENVVNIEIAKDVMIFTYRDNSVVSIRKQSWNAEPELFVDPMNDAMNDGANQRPLGGGVKA